MNQYVRSIGSMLILVYSLFTAFFFIDNVFTNIIFLSRYVFIHKFFGIPVFLFFKILLPYFCVLLLEVYLRIK